MNKDKFAAFMTEGLDASVQVVGEDFEMRVDHIPNLIEFSLKCARLQIPEVKLNVGRDGGTVVVFKDAINVDFDPDPLGSRLTPRQREVLPLLALGKTNQEIADDLEVSVKTIDSHRGQVLKKLGLRNNAELARYAVRNGLVHS